MLFFSICIAVYNAEKYLRDGVESILSQDFDDYEIILINDASTDNSGAVCDSLASEHPGKVRVIHHFENMGSLLARRAFYNAAKGEEAPPTKAEIVPPKKVEKPQQAAKPVKKKWNNI